MQLKTVLNRCHHFPSFVYGEACFVDGDIVVQVKPRANSRPVCSKCDRKGAKYDTAREARLFEFVPPWGFRVYLKYSMRLCVGSTARIVA